MNVMDYYCNDVRIADLFLLLKKAVDLTVPKNSGAYFLYKEKYLVS